MRRLLVAAALVAFLACNRSQPEDLGALYRTVRAEVEAGELIHASAGADHGRALAVERHDALPEWRFRLQKAEILLFSRRAEQALTVLDGKMPDTSEFAPLAAHRMLLQSRALSILHREAESDALLERAWQTAEAAGAVEVMVEIETLRGNRLDSQRKYRESEAMLARARERARSIGSTYHEAVILQNLGVYRLGRSRFDEAVGYFEEASRVAGPQRTTLYSVAQQNLAICYAALGETDRAITIGLQAIARHEHSGAEAFLGLALGELGRTYLLKGDLKQAAKYMDRALTLALETHATRDAAVWASNLSSVYREMGDLANAESLNQESIRLRTADKIPLLYYNELNAAWIAAARGNRADAEQRFARAMKDGQADPSVAWDAEEGLGTLALREGRLQDAERHFGAAVEVVERTRSALGRTEFKLPFLTRLIRMYRLYVDTLLQEGETERALAVADSSRAQVLAERSGAAPVARLAPGAFREIARTSNAVLLSFWLGARQSHAWVVTAREVHHVELPPAGQIETQVAAYQEAVERQLADPARTGLPAGEQLFAMVVEPVRKWIPPGSSVVVSPDGVLHGLNLESLPVPGDIPRYWLEDVSISIAPSLALLKTRPRAVAPPTRLLLIGNPAGVDPAFPALAHAAGEIAAVTQRFGEDRTVVIDGERATADSWWDALPTGYSAIHFTAHAVANAESPLDSAVLLTHGKLYARDVMTTPLAANLVTVSACRGVGTRLYSGEGLVGFAWAFLRAGAHNVIAGLWDVNDESTSQLMDVLYREWSAGKSPAAALHTAKLSLARSRGNLRKPYYWAPFQLYTVAP